MAFIDTHAHLNDEQLSTNLDEVMARCNQENVESVICIGIDEKTSLEAVEIADRYDNVFAAVGIQPNYVSQVSENCMDVIKQLCSHPKSVAIGETGLDRYWDYAPFPLQQTYFRQHIELSLELKMPFVVHMRDCAPDIVSVLWEYESKFPLSGVMHSYTGDLESANRCVDAGLHISFAGMVTYKKAEELRKVASSLPLERLLIETDAPYLSPHPHRGKRPNEPSMVVHTAACLAELHDMSAEDFGAVTTANAKALFGI